MTADRLIQSIAPRRIVAVSSAGELAELVGQCRREQLPLCDYGLGCRGLGAAPPPDHLQVDLPAGLLEHDRQDFVVHVLAATPLDRLNEQLAPTGQFLPLDGFDGQWSVGEALAHNLSGPLRTTYGSGRDLLLGVQFVDGAGRQVRAGGRTVKNVAGYDLSRLLVGSMNTLGLFVAVTLRTHAIPPAVTALTLPDFDPTLLDSHANDLLVSDARPWYLDWQQDSQGRAALHLAYAGSPAERHARCHALPQWLSQVGYRLADVQRQPDCSLAQDQARRQARRRWRTTMSAVLKLIVPPSRTGWLIRQLEQWCPPGSLIEALPLHGVVYAGGRWSVEQAASVCRRGAEAGAMWTWFRRPRHSPSLDPMGPPQPDWPMQAAIKRALDPDGLLNPGRLPWDRPGPPRPDIPETS